MNAPIRYLKQEDAEIMARTVVERTASRGCVEVHGLSWTSPSLLEWENRQREMGITPKVDVRINELDLGYVYIDVPERGVGPFKAWSRQSQFAEGLSLLELNRLKRAIKDKDLAFRLGELADEHANTLRITYYAELGRGNDPAAQQKLRELEDQLAKLRLPPPDTEPTPDQTPIRPPEFMSTSIPKQERKSKKRTRANVESSHDRVVPAKSAVRVSALPEAHQPELATKPSKEMTHISRGSKQLPKPKFQSRNLIRSTA